MKIRRGGHSWPILLGGGGGGGGYFVSRDSCRGWRRIAECRAVQGVGPPRPRQSPPVICATFLRTPPDHTILRFRDELPQRFSKFDELRCLVES